VAHVFLVALTSIFGYAFANVRVANISWWYIAVVITVSYGVVTWFIEIYGAAAEGISTSFETEHFASQDYQYMQRAIPVLYFLLSHIVRRLNSVQAELIVSVTATSENDQYSILYGFN
jgi:hypothetical protein